MVLDASVVIKWFKPDEKSDAADELLAAHAAGREEIVVPTLLLYEFTNALWYSKRLTANDIAAALDALNGVKLRYVSPDRELLVDAVRMSGATQLSTYDAAYVALARCLNCRLVTADQKLAQKAKSLGAIELL